MSNNPDAFPQISIVTISYNAVAFIEETILSVVNQTYPHLDYIIIDGGSTDGTIDIIRKYQAKISYWISEPDNGLYDAMNKGIKVAKGEWINFMNCGDTFYSNSVISQLFNKPVAADYSVVYGNVIFKYATHSQKASEGHSKYMPACHQSTFCRTAFMKDFLFDTKYKIAADFDFFHKLYQTGHPYLYKDVTVSIFDAANGLSSQNKYLRNKEFIYIKEKNPIKRYLLLGKLQIKHLMKRLLATNH